MKDLTLSRPGRAYVVAVVALGGWLIASSMLQVAQQATAPWWVVLAVMTLISAPLSLRLPSLRTTVTVTETFVFASALLFGPAAATITVALDGFGLSVRAKRRSLHRALFNVAEPAISVWVSAQLFYVVSEVPPLFDSPVGLGQLLVPLLLMTTSYFVLNGILSLTAVWFETRMNPVSFLRAQLPHTGINYFTSCCCVVLLIQNLPNLTFAVIGMFVPLIVLTYASSKLSTARVEEAKKHLDDLSRLYLSTIEALALAIDAKDQVTSGHIRRVQLHSVALARRLGLADEAEIKAVEASALLHDLGKLAVPEHILNKPGKLSPNEFEQMKTHATIGADILSTIDFPYPVEPIVRHHHEMWNGRGYPGIAGEAIPIGARILSVVDCFDALTSDRPYRRALDKDQALAVILGRRGIQYDPRVVDTFVGMVDELLEASGPRVGATVESDKEAEIREVVVPRLPAQATPPADHEDVSGLGDTGGARETDEDGHVLPTFDTICRYVEAEAPGAVTVLYRHQADQGQLAASRVSAPEHEFLLRDFAMPLGDRLTGWVGANRQTIYNSDPSLDFGDLANAWSPRMRSCFAIPLVGNDALLGVLSVYSPDPQGLTRSQTRRVSQLASEGLELRTPADSSDDAPPSQTIGPRPVPFKHPTSLPV